MNPRRDLRRATERFARDVIRRSDFANEIPKVGEALVRRGREDLADNLFALAKMPHETREGICANARVIIRPYNRENIVRTTDNPNFDMRRFVRGAPDAPNPEMVIPPHAQQGFEGYQPRGRWPTLYVTGEDQRAVAPHMAMMASALVRASAQWTEESERLRNEQPQPGLIGSDEMGTIAPWRSLPEDAAKGGNGYNLLMGFQSLSQAVDRYGKQILSLAQNIALGPGLRDGELELFSKLNGETYIEKTSESESETRGKDVSKGATFTHDWLQVPRVPVDAIANGYPGQPGAFSYFPANTSAHRWVHSTPYFRSAPWFHILMNEAYRVANHGSEAQLRLPMPVMHRHGLMHPSLNAQAITAYHDLVRKWTQARAQKGIR